MSWTQGDLDAIDRAIRTGALKVRGSDGKEVTYRSLDELQRIRAEIVAVVTPSAAATGPIVGFAEFGRD